MDKRRVLGAFGVIAVAVAFALTGAATTPAAAAAAGGVDLSSEDAVRAYLASKGVDASTVVWQRGPLNYAGPSCPGAGWNCTTSTRVVQLSSVGGQNEFVCEPEEDATTDEGECVILQVDGETNRAECRLEDDEPSATQKCVIGQEGERNSAIVRQLIVQDEEPTQDAYQNADVAQTATEKNDLHLYQTVRQSMDAGPAQMQDANQVALVVQNGGASVGNFSHVHQVQDQELRGSATSQQQNTVADTTADCAPAFKAVAPNQCANVDQAGAGGSTNESQLHQTIAQRATSTTESAVHQGSLDGGNEARVHQETGDDGRNVNSAHETVTQRAAVPEDSPPPIQQTDPGCCGFGSQIGGKSSVEKIHLSVTQSSQPAGVQDAQLLAASNTDGGCSITLHGRNNADAEAFTFNDSTACVETFTMTCFSAPAGEEDVILASQDSVGDCTDPEEGEIDLTGGESLTVITTTPTFGLPIEMPSFGEPSD